MTKIDTSENSIREYILIKNPPKNNQHLLNIVSNWNSKRIVKYKNINQFFIKEHNYIYLPKIALGFYLTENYSYLDSKINSDFIDFDDYLIERKKHIDKNNKITDTIFEIKY